MGERVESSVALVFGFVRYCLSTEEEEVFTGERTTEGEGDEELSGRAVVVLGGVNLFAF